MKLQASASKPDDAQAHWSEEELKALEAAHPEGISTQQVVELFAARGARLSEATFRKYVQLGLLPRSVRVGRKGKHRGSQGLYPASVVRQIDRIRRLMAQGYTIGEIQEDFLFVGGEIEGIGRQLMQLIERIEQAVAPRGEAAANTDEVVVRAISETRDLAEELLGRLRAIDGRLAMRARMARAAV
ncbi:MAG: MerR family transcriptional regulator [Myxococcales bacterium]|nr:MerR family transcriptional regulator [Myxococcales bacterium]